MEFNRESLLRTLESVQHGLSRRGDTVEQSTCFIFDSGHVATYNDEIVCRAPLPGLDEDVSAAVPAKPLLALLPKLSEECVTLTFDAIGGKLEVKGKNRKATIRLEAEITSAYAAVEQPEEWREVAEDFSDAVALVRDCASNDAAHFSLTCIHITPDFVEACDRYQILRYSFDTGFPEEVLLKRDSLKCVVGLQMTEFGQTQAWTHFRRPNGLSIACRRFEETYFDLSAHIEVKGHPIILPKTLTEAVEKAKIFTDETPDSSNVLVTIDKGRLILRGQGVNGWYEERRKIQWDGDRVQFLIAPAILSEIVKRYNECELCPDKLKVDGGKWVYISVLNVPEEPAAAKGEKAQESQEEED